MMSSSLCCQRDMVIHNGQIHARFVAGSNRNVFHVSTFAIYDLFVIHLGFLSASQKSYRWVISLHTWALPRTGWLWCSDRWLAVPPDGDGEWRLADRRRPAGPGADPLEWRTGPVPTHAHRAEAEVQGDECRWTRSLLFPLLTCRQMWSCLRTSALAL